MLCILMISITAFQSVEAIAVGFCISNWMDVLISMVPAKRLLNYGIKKQFADLWRILLASTVMFAVVQTMTLLNLHGLLLLAIQLLAGVIVYVGIGYVLKIESQRELMKLGLRLVKNKKS